MLGLPGLGLSAEETWGEIWPLLEPLMKDTMNGIPVKREDQLLFWERLNDGGPNRMEEVYATWYYTPMWGRGRVIGNLLILFEQQEKQVCPLVSSAQPLFVEAETRYRTPSALVV